MADHKNPGDSIKGRGAYDEKINTIVTAHQGNYYFTLASKEKAGSQSR
jgi:hypothetical protein